MQIPQSAPATCECSGSARGLLLDGPGCGPDSMLRRWRCRWTGRAAGLLQSCRADLLVLVPSGYRGGSCFQPPEPLSFCCASPAAQCADRPSRCATSLPTTTCSPPQELLEHPFLRPTAEPSGMPGLSKEQLKLLLSQVRDPAIDPASLPCNLTLHHSIPQPAAQAAALPGEAPTVLTTSKLMSRLNGDSLASELRLRRISAARHQPALSDAFAASHALTCTLLLHTTCTCLRIFGCCTYYLSSAATQHLKQQTCMRRSDLE